MSKKKKGAKGAKKSRRDASRRRNTIGLLLLTLAIGLLAAGSALLLPDSGAAAGLPPVRIRQVMTANPSVCLSVDGAFYDWIQLENLGDAPVDLTGWRLTNRLDLRGAYVFEGLTLAAGEKTVVYCAPAPEDYAGGERFTGFRLNADGESLILCDVGERHMQVLDVPAMPAGSVYVRDGDAYETLPFFQSPDAGELAPDICPAHDPAGVSISEIMAKNASVLADEDGNHPDWIELYNGSTEPVSLAGWSLSDDDMDRTKWVFPDVTLEPGAYKIVFASGKDRAGEELHASFKLSSRGEALRLYDAAHETVSWAAVGEAVKDRSVARQADGRLLADSDPSPGYPNTEGGVRQALHEAYDGLVENELGLYINEVFCTGKGDDWLELANAGHDTVDLSGMGLSDSPSHPRKWQFPEGAKLAPGGYAVVRFTGPAGESGSSKGIYAANLALAPEETVVLAKADGEVIDRVRLLDQHRNVSFGRAEGHDTYRYFEKLTPGKANAAKSYAACADEVTFSLPGGSYKEKAVELELSSNEGMTIYYTTDGSTPTAKSKVYAGPISVSKNIMVQAVAWREDALASQPVAHSFVLGAKHTMRVVCITGSHSRLDGSGGVLNTGSSTEQKVFVQMYEPDGTRIVSQSCGLKMAGHHSRTHYSQKGFSLRARKKYGEGKFHAKLFSNRDYEEYDSLFMRASGQDVFQTHMRDSILTALAADTTVLYQETELCAVYVNGRYWGEYNMRERVSPDMIAQYEGWDNPDDVILMEGSGERMYTVQGSSGNYYDMMSKVRSMDFSKDSSIERLRELVDVENYLDYVALQMFTANQDLNNLRCYCIPKAGVKWRWIVYDLDLSFQVDANSIARWLRSGGVGSITTQDNTLFIRLMKNAGMKDYFLTRMGELLATTFSADNVTGKIRERTKALNAEMKRNCKRWGWSTSTWERYVSAMTKYAKSRPGKLMNYFKKTMRLSDGKMDRYFGAALAADK